MRCCLGYCCCFYFYFLSNHCKLCTVHMRKSAERIWDFALFSKRVCVCLCVRKMALQTELCWIQWQYGICMKQKENINRKKKQKRFGVFLLDQYLLFRWGMICSHIHLIIMIIMNSSHYKRDQILFLKYEPMINEAWCHTAHPHIHFVYVTVIKITNNEKFAFLLIKNPKMYNSHLIWATEQKKTV